MEGLLEHASSEIVSKFREPQDLMQKENSELLVEASGDHEMQS